MGGCFATSAAAALEYASQEEAPPADIHLRLVQIFKFALLRVEGAQLHRTHQIYDRELQSAPAQLACSFMPAFIEPLQKCYDTR